MRPLGNAGTAALKMIIIVMVASVSLENLKGVSGARNGHENWVDQGNSRECGLPRCIANSSGTGYETMRGSKSWDLLGDSPRHATLIDNDPRKRWDVDTDDDDSRRCPAVGRPTQEPQEDSGAWSKHQHRYVQLGEREHARAGYPNWTLTADEGVADLLTLAAFRPWRNFLTTSDMIECLEKLYKVSDDG